MKPFQKKTSQTLLLYHLHFCSSFGLAGPYVAGAMAGGIASVELVTAFFPMPPCYLSLVQEDYHSKKLKIALEETLHISRCLGYQSPSFSK